MMPKAALGDRYSLVTTRQTATKGQCLVKHIATDVVVAEKPLPYPVSTTTINPLQSIFVVLSYELVSTDGFRTLPEAQANFLKDMEMLCPGCEASYLGRCYC